MTRYRGASKERWPSRTLMRGESNTTPASELTLCYLSEKTIERAWELIEANAPGCESPNEVSFVLRSELDIDRETADAILADYVDIARWFYGKGG